MTTLDDANRTGPPWERREELGPVVAILDTITGVLARPTETFRKMRVGGDPLNPYLFTVLLTYAGTLISYAWNQVGTGTLVKLMDAVEPPAEFQQLLSVLEEQGATLGVMQVIGMVVLVPIAVGLALVLNGCMVHVGLMLLGGANRGFEATLRVLAYVMGAGAVFNLVPILGGLIGAVWMLVCQVIGLREAHETTTGRAIFAVLLPMLLCCCLVGGFLVVGLTLLGSTLGPLMDAVSGQM